MVEKKQCQAQVYGDRFSHQCQKNAVAERDGKFYCMVHDPEYIKEKRRKWDEKFDKEYIESQERYHREEVIKRVCEPFTTEWLEANANFILASKDMYAAISLALNETPGKPLGDDIKNVLRKAKSKAEGK